MHRLITILLTVTIGFFNSCTSDKKLNTEAVQKEIESREAKKITPAQLIDKAHEIGDKIALNAKKELGRNLQKALQEGGIENAISFCNINAMPIVDSLSKLHQASIRRVSMKTRNPSDNPTDVEKTLLEAYEFQWKDSIALKTNVQAVSEKEYLFTKPILIDNALCLTCHGTSENGLSQETRDFILSKYPEDQATGYTIGDLRGMWSITLPKRELVEAF